MKQLVRVAAIAAVSMSVFGLPGLARAGEGDEATASALFQEGKVLVAAGKYEEACPKFQEAKRIRPTTGTLLTIGDCLEHVGKLASAWGAFKEAEMMARNTNDDDREKEAVRRAGLLAPKLSRLALVVPPAARLPGFEVRRDGELVGDGQWGSALPVDPGWHKIEVKATGRKSWSTSVRIEVGSSSTSVDVPVLELAPADPAAAPPFWSGQRIAGASVGGVGVVGLVVASVFGARAMSRMSASKQSCTPAQPADICDAAGLAARHDAKTAGTISTASFVVGGLAAAAGVVVFFTAPSSSSTSSSTTTGRGPRLMITAAAGGPALALEGGW